MTENPRRGAQVVQIKLWAIVWIFVAFAASVVLFAVVLFDISGQGSAIEQTIHNHSGELTLLRNDVAALDTVNVLTTKFNNFVARCDKVPACKALLPKSKS